MARPVWSWTLVTIQFACLLALAATGPWFAAAPWLLALEFAGVGLGVWAILTMRIDRVRVTPDVRPDTELVVRGPYRWIRHPMYLSLILVGLALAWNAPSPLRWGILALLTVNQVVKLTYEETLLVAALPGYRAYRTHTKRLLPFLF